MDEFKLVGRGFGKRSDGRPELYYRLVDDVAGGRGPPSAALLRISGRAASFRRWRLCPLHSARRSGQFHHHRRTPALHQSKFVFVFFLSSILRGQAPCTVAIIADHEPCNVVAVSKQRATRHSSTCYNHVWLVYGSLIGRTTRSSRSAISAGSTTTKKREAGMN